MLIQGSCHCGNIAFTLGWEPDPKQIVARRCDCGFCTRHGGLWTSYPQGVLRVRISDSAQHSRYRFGTGTAVFHVCRRCGAVPVVTSDVEGHEYAVVSVTAFTNVDAALLREAPVSFADEALPARLARRQRNWIADVAFQAGGGAGGR
jgi:hypothetical protein